MASKAAPWLESHNKSVEVVADSVRQFYERKEKFRIFHGSTNSTRPGAGQHGKVVDTSKLSNVLMIDAARRTALVEPNVPMDRLVEETLKHGLVPPVVMEYPGITVGGGYAGTCGESSSFKHGFFDSTINYIEMVLANGDIITCSEREHPDLFHGAAGAMGTLGITTLVELQLQVAGKYVETTYFPVAGMLEAVQKIKEATLSADSDYIDGILFSKNRGVVISGRMTDTPQSNLPIAHFSDARDPWFYLHVQELIDKTTGPVTEAIPLAEYLFRYDRGGFWVGASAFKYFKLPFNDFTRWWLDDFLHTRMMYTALHASGQSRNYVIQDLALPFDTAAQFVDYTNETFGIYPLWLCPLRQTQAPTMHPHSQRASSGRGNQSPMLNIGLWGYGSSDYEEFVRTNKDLERKLRDLGGMKWLYAHTYYSEEEFWQIYDRTWYEDLRTKYHATSLPTVYEKAKIDVDKQRKAVKSPSFSDSVLGSWPLSGLYGIKKAIDSGTYMPARTSTWKSTRG
jgi:delta24-sterol reductase